MQQVTPWFAWAQRNHPKSVARATHLTKFGTPGDNVRFGGPGKRRKNPAQYDRIGREREARA